MYSNLINKLIAQFYSGQVPSQNISKGGTNFPLLIKFTIIKPDLLNFLYAFLFYLFGQGAVVLLVQANCLHSFQCPSETIAIYDFLFVFRRTFQKRKKKLLQPLQFKRRSLSPTEPQTILVFFFNIFQANETINLLIFVF